MPPKNRWKTKHDTDTATRVDTSRMKVMEGGKEVVRGGTGRGIKVIEGVVHHRNTPSILFLHQNTPQMKSNEKHCFLPGRHCKRVMGFLSLSESFPGCGRIRHF